MPVSTEKMFQFKFQTREHTYTLTAPITIPLDQSVAEYSGRLITSHNLPCFVEEALITQLGIFVTEETDKFRDECAEATYLKIKNGEVDINGLVNKWSQAYTEEILDYAKTEPLSNEVVFSEVYHALIHSPALETLLNLEHTYALSVGEIIVMRDKDQAHLEQHQGKDMEQAVQQLGDKYTDEQINQLAQRHFENTQIKESKWASELSNLQETQKREYRDWVMKVHEDTQATDATPGYFRALSNKMTGGDLDEGPLRREESFTVHLGAQLKTTHNLRFISGDALDLCRHIPHKVGGAVVAQPQRLQTAMSLYSNSLCGLVLMVDNRLNSYTGIKRDFSKVCEQSTDFHFPDLEQQFTQIEAEVMRANEWRAQQRQSSVEEGDQISVKSSSSSSSEKDDNKSTKMQSGDFYVTRHSNLSDVHVVFHMVADDSVRSSVSEISSRHDVIMGYRNVLKACFRYDVHTITLPLLLIHEMTEEMTIPWCLKRAELVFKCVKGFMMELATWSGQEARTIQFLVPKSLSDETFQSICNMMPSIFRMSNPVVAKKA